MACKFVMAHYGKNVIFVPHNRKKKKQKRRKKLHDDVLGPHMS
jgi:hypothetical protein